MHDFGHTISIRNLIHHISGIRCTFPELLGMAEWRESDVVTQEDIFRLLQNQRDLDFSTGTEFASANSNYLLLALICERVSGQSFGEFCKELIFEPLGMDHPVVLDILLKLIPGKAAAYYDDGGGNWSNALLADAVMSPTNIYSTVEDMALWDENFYTGQTGGL
jgi:CubicO group peptidase (beta-lactamase class C family)